MPLHGRHTSRECRVAAPLLVMLACGATGCTDDGLRRVVVGGNVTFGNQAVVDGQIRFVPQEGQSAPITIEPITNGRYRCGHAGGVPVGLYRVEVLAFHPDDPEPTGPGIRARRQLIPSKYNKATQLTIDVSGAVNPMTYDLALE